MATDSELDSAIQTAIDSRAAQGFPQRVRQADGREIELTPLAELVRIQDQVQWRGRTRARLIVPIAE